MKADCSNFGPVRDSVVYSTYQLNIIVPGTHLWCWKVLPLVGHTETSRQRVGARGCEPEEKVSARLCRSAVQRPFRSGHRVTGPSLVRRIDQRN